MRRYRFLLTPKWLGILALALVAAAVMVLLARWQYHRYEARHEYNARVAASATATPVPLASVPLSGDVAYTRVTVTGTYDPAHTVLVRGRTVDNRVGFEIVTPLRLDDGTAVLVDRGWVPPAPGGARAQPAVPPTPSGVVTVVGVLKQSESRGTAVTRTGDYLETRRVSVPRIAASVPYPLYRAFVQLDEQTPAAGDDFVPVPADTQNDWLNGGYAVQWLLFAAMTLFAYGWLARRQARGPVPPGSGGPGADGGGRGADDGGPDDGGPDGGGPDGRGGAGPGVGPDGRGGAGPGDGPGGRGGVGRDGRGGAGPGDGSDGGVPPATDPATREPAGRGPV